MFPDWLNELVDEYQNQKINDTRLFRLGRAFQDEPADIMQAAVLAYVRENKYFPRTADLNPYVLQAHEDARGRIPYHQLQQQPRYSDDDILAWEQRRGTMPPDYLLETDYLATEQPHA
jgi:hypothetical protein